MFTLPVSCWRSDSGVSKSKKKEGSRFCIAVVMLLFVGRASLSELWNRLCRPRESSVDCVSSIFATNSYADVNYYNINIQLRNSVTFGRF